VFCKRAKLPVSATLLILLILALEGCARRQARTVERLAVMPIENLSGDAQLDWPSRAAAAVVAYDLAGAKDVFARQVVTPAGAAAMQASELLEGYFYERNGRIAIRATLQDLSRAKTVKMLDVEGAAAGGFLPLANELARQISTDARTFGTSNESALRFYGEALGAKDSDSMERDLEAATKADGGFASVYIDEVRMRAEKGDRDGARQAAEAGKRARLDAIDRADLEYVAANATGDARDRLSALDSLSKAMPANAAVCSELGQLRYARREFQRAAADYRAAASLDADDPEIWNQLGYTLAFSGDLGGARQALAQYQNLAPGDVNALDSLGEVSYFRGDFQAAEQYFEKAAARSPADLVKAAEARLMLGDLKGADALYAKHLGRAANGQASGAAYQMAQWEFLTGRRAAGVARMEKLAAQPNGDLQFLAVSQLAIWKLEDGDKKAAAELTNRLDVARAQSREARGMMELTRFLVLGNAADSGSKMANAYALLLDRKFAEAVPLLQAVYAETTPSNDGQVRTLLAWAYVETKAVDKAAKLTDDYPLPLSTGDPQFASLVFPRYLALRSAVLQQQGKGEEGARLRALYSKYGGAAN
jgi:Flp pilus assembly protein TadD